jgi:outer membrane protein OmpA-like peptidoglycan-associated protein
MRFFRFNLSLLIFLLLVSPEALQGEVFRFQFSPGSKFRAVAQVDETVIQRYGFEQSVQQSELRYKIAYTVESVEDDSGFLRGIFQIANRSSGDIGVYQWNEENPTAYWKDRQGRMRFPQFYSFPVVRNVPLFPERDILPGETWVGVGEEVHDFRASGSDLGIIRFPINVAYQYTGIEEYKGSPLHAIDASYQVYHRFPASRGPAPEQISGFSSQHLYWDNANGYLKAYTEEFELVMHLNDGSSLTFRGTASAEVIQAELMEKEKVAEEIRESLSRDGVADSDVRVDEEGVTISLHDIRFQPDSARFLPGEERKISAVADILKKYPDRDVLVTGHTALAGTFEGREALSLERARVVAERLVRLGARESSRIVIRGMGAREPLADNATEAGRRLNRRVEITLLEN